MAMPCSIRPLTSVQEWMLLAFSAINIGPCGAILVLAKSNVDIKKYEPRMVKSYISVKDAFWLYGSQIKCYESKEFIVKFQVRIFAKPDADGHSHITSESTQAVKKVWDGIMEDICVSYMTRPFSYKQEGETFIDLMQSHFNDKRYDTRINKHYDDLSSGYDGIGIEQEFTKSTDTREYDRGPIYQIFRDESRSTRETRPAAPTEEATSPAAPREETKSSEGSKE